MPKYTSRDQGKKEEGKGSPIWLYDTIMSQIEPDLTTNHIPLLKEKYARETNEEKVERLQSYTKAFEVFDEALEKTLQTIDDDVRLFKRLMREEAIKEEASEQKRVMEKSEQAIDFDI